MRAEGWCFASALYVPRKDIHVHFIPPSELLHHSCCFLDKRPPLQLNTNHNHAITIEEVGRLCEDAVHSVDQWNFSHVRFIIEKNEGSRQASLYNCFDASCKLRNVAELQLTGTNLCHSIFEQLGAMCLQFLLWKLYWPLSSLHFDPIFRNIQLE